MEDRKDDLIEWIKDEVKYLNRNELIEIRDIILRYYQHITCMTETSIGLRLPLGEYDMECLIMIKDYIEKIYEELVEYRNRYCADLGDINRVPKFV